MRRPYGESNRKFRAGSTNSRDLTRDVICLGTSRLSPDFPPRFLRSRRKISNETEDRECCNHRSFSPRFLGDNEFCTIQCERTVDKCLLVPCLSNMPILANFRERRNHFGPDFERWTVWFGSVCILQISHLCQSIMEVSTGNSGQTGRNQISPSQRR